MIDSTGAPDLDPDLAGYPVDLVDPCRTLCITNGTCYRPCLHKKYASSNGEIFTKYYSVKLTNSIYYMNVFIIGLVL